MSVPYWLLLPAAAAVIYTVASLFFKRGYAEGAGTMQTFHVANFIAVPFFLPLFFVNPGHLPLLELWRPAIVSGLIYAGTLGTFAAIRRGDVSMVTPLLGTKVVFVAMAFVLVTGGALSSGLWIASVLAAAGIFVIGKADLQPGRAGGAAIMLCLVSAAFFGLTDVLIGQWAPHFGGTTFLAAVPVGNAVFSLIHLTVSRRSIFPLPARARGPMLCGGVLLAAQAIAMGLTLTFCNDPAGINILYGTRGLWSIVLVWSLGAWFSNRERYTAGPAVMLSRLTGAALITAGVVIAVLERSS